MSEFRLLRPEYVAQICITMIMEGLEVGDPHDAEVEHFDDLGWQILFSQHP